MSSGFGKEAWEPLAEAATASTEKNGRCNMMMIAAGSTAIANLNEVIEPDKVLTQSQFQNWKVYVKNVLVSQCL